MGAMRVRLLVLAILVLAVRAPFPVARADAPTRKVWVYFRDKGPDAAARVQTVTLSARARARRALRGSTKGATFEDLPLAPSYVAEVAGRVTRVRQQVRWLNAMSVEASADQIASLERLAFVARVDLVRGYRRRADDERAGRAQAVASSAATPPRPSAARTAAFDYGLSAGQLTQIGVPAAHEMGLHGEGVMVAVFDTGFDTLSHEAFAAMSIVDRHDFVNGDDDVANGRDRGEGSHGTETLSVLGGWAPGHLIGP